MAQPDFYTMCATVFAPDGSFDDDTCVGKSTPGWASIWAVAATARPMRCRLVSCRGFTPSG